LTSNKKKKKLQHDTKQYLSAESILIQLLN